MKEKILITVKTYPTPSSKYDELVCTAGMREDGSWVRIYPIPFRKLSYKSQYKKYQWIEIDIVKNQSDFRPESFRPYSIDKEPNVLGTIRTEGNWEKRKKIVLKNIYTNLAQLIGEAKNKTTCVSLSVFKPTKIVDMEIKSCEREWDSKKIARMKQMNLFENSSSFQVVRKLPYKFSYIFTDDAGVKSKLMIEDWEIGELYWNCLRKHNGDEGKAIIDVRKKYMDEFLEKKDIYLFLGTTQQHHFVSINPFIIIGVFYPPKEKQTKMF